jgi:iron complex transport system substrate-binding protein
MTKGIREADGEARIASLLPAATEIVVALGLEARLVGRSHECDFPPSVERLPALTRSRVLLEGASAEIDRRLREHVAMDPAADALGIYEVIANELERVAPTHVVTQMQCEVCAVSPRDVEWALGAMTGTRARLVSLAAADLAGVMEDFLAVADALGETEAGRRLVGRCRERFDALRCATAGLVRPRVLQLEWLDPPMSASHWTPELIEIAGGEPALGEAGGKSVRLSWPSIAAADPDAIVLAPCGFGLSRIREELALLNTRPDWLQLRAVRQNRVFLADGNQYFNRPGPRLVESAELLTEILHPTAFDCQHRERGWTVL